MCAAIRGGLWLAVTICRIFFFMQVLAGKVFVTFEAVSQGELGAATGAGRFVNAEYLGLLTILEAEPQARPASLIRRPRSQNVTPYLNCYICGTILQKWIQRHIDFLRILW